MKQISLFDFAEPAPEKPEDKTGEAEPKQEKQTKERKQQAGKDAPLREQEEVVKPIVEPVAIEIEVEEEVREVPDLIFEPDPLPEAEPEKIVKKVPEKKTETRGRKSSKEMEPLSVAADIPPDEALFSKRYYSIGNVAEMFRENVSLIRFWENEFDILKPKKNKKGDRFFRPEDIKNLKLIYTLLREQKYTIDGAKEYLKRNKKQDETVRIMDELSKIKSFLLQLKAGL